LPRRRSPVPESARIDTLRLFIAVLSIAALTAFRRREEWLNLIAGLSLIASPWLLGFQNSDALMVNVVIGTVVAAMAALEAWITHTGERAPKSISR
jgi:SPW repeat